ncbi:hypothetical protein [Neoroseomonas soli]|uniref:Uncharacterized protein n=1 Tax=Neoroseomonas soli TaxID=1081025 RepID=A0A9X9X1B2_9PROT|nr:hypothetical protein [Neoroseomonas soli]MBR0673191.1 hypothetical protein [Neoroseomonas soli]
MPAGNPSALSRFSADLSRRWTQAKPVVLALAAGLVAGPIISGMVGFQMRTSTAQTLVRDGVVGQQAIFCADRARIDTPDPSRLDWTARDALARRFATMPGGGTEIDPDVARACATRLTR